jgi:tetratricopeptide (TPR) repeat protein
MKTFPQILLLLILISIEGIAQYDCGSFEDCLNVGIAAYQEENYEGVIGYLTNAIEKWKETDGTDVLVKAYNHRAMAFSNSEKNQEAINDLNKVIELNPKYAPGYRNRAGVFETTGEYSKAIDDYTITIKLENGADDYAKRGAAFGKIQKFDDAIKDYTKALELNPSWVDYHLQLGQIYFLNKQYDKVQEEATKAADLNAIIPDPYMLSARGYMVTQNFDKALEQVESAVTFAPDTKEVYEMRAMIYNKLGKHTEAIADLKKAVDLGSEVSKQDLKTIYKIDY